MFSHISGGVTETLKLGRTIKRPYRVLGKDEQTVVTRCNKLAEKTIAVRVTLAPWLAGVFTQPSESALAVAVQNKNLEETLLLFHGT